MANPSQTSGTLDRGAERAGGNRMLAPPWLLLVPALLAVGIVIFYPAISGSFLAFTDWNGLTRDRTFTGLENFRDLLRDRQALAALRNTLIIAGTVTVVQNLVGLLLALAVTSRIRSRYLLRTLFFTPVVLTPLIVAYLWQYLYSPRGALARVLEGVGLEGGGWLGDPASAIWAVTLVVIWQFAGYSMVIFIAGLEGVPEELYDAADIDGASSWARFWHITRPMLAPAITINLMLSLIGGLKLFDQIWALTQGGPGYATETLSTALYKQAFVFAEYGYGMAIAFVLAILVAGLAFLQLYALQQQED